MTANTAPLLVVRAGLLEYGQAWELQQGLVAARQRGLVDDTLLLLEHPHTYTIGRRGQWADVLLSAVERAQRSVTVYEVDRGGEVTYHGPGQLVGYPIVDLRGRGLDVHQYVHGLEDILIAALQGAGVEACTLPGIVGVWAGWEKIAALGVRVSRGVTMHGFALNVNTDLAYFDGIIPCGITDRGVTSVQKVQGQPFALDIMMELVLARLCAAYPGDVRETTLAEAQAVADEARLFLPTTAATLA